MEYTFSLTRVFNYNKLLKYVDSEGEIETIVEESAGAPVVLSVWEEDIKVPFQRRELILERFDKWAKQQGIKYSIIRGQSR